MMIDLIAFFLVGLSGIILGFALSISDVKKLIQIHRTPVYSPDIDSNGKIVEVTGKIPLESRSITSPISQTACVLWHAEVLASKPSDEGVSWETIYNETSDYPFDMQNNTGIFRIYPTNAELILRKDFYEVGLTFKPAIQAFIEKLQPPNRDFFGQPEPFQLHEQVVKAGETIYVLGTLKEKNDIRTISSANNDAPFVISDRSQRALSNTLVWRIIARVFLLTSFGILIALLIANRK